MPDIETDSENRGEENKPINRCPLGSYGSVSNGGYVELLNGSVPCPTCRGLGRVPKEYQNELVALIPLKDKRLKPRRTVLYVIMAVALCLVVAGLIMFFLFPRDVVLYSNRPMLDPTHLYVNMSRSFANITVMNSYNFSNNNFFPVYITGAQMKSLYDTKQITVSSNKTKVEIPARETHQYRIKMQFIFDKGNDWGFLVKMCKDKRPWVHNLPITFELTANYSCLGHVEQTTLTTFQPVSCYNASESDTNL